MDFPTPSANHSIEEDVPKLTRCKISRDTMLVRIAVGLFIEQTVALIRLSSILYAHFDLTKDFMEFYQAWFLIAHGQLNPYLTSVHGYFWQNHLEWIMWPFALLYFIYPHGITLLIVQDVATVGAEAMAFGMIRDMVKNQPESRRQSLWWVQWLGLLLLVFNPWVYAANIFDFHFHTLEAFFVTAAVWQFYRKHVRWGYVFALLCFATSDVSVTYLAAVGLLLLFWRQWREGIVVGLMGVLGFIVEQHLFYHGLGGLGIAFPHAAKTSSVSTRTASPLLSLWRLPRAGFALFWPERMNWYANIGPSGFIGILSPIGLLVPGLVLFEASLGGTQFFQPGWAVVSAYALLAVGTVAVLVWLAGRSTVIARIVGGLILVNLVGWFVVGISELPFRTALPTTAATNTLRHLRQTIPRGAEVVASQAVIGRFGAREHVQLFWWRILVQSGTLYFIILPYQGIQENFPAVELARIAYVANNLHAHLLAHHGGVWAFRWTPSAPVHSISIPSTVRVLPAWALKTAVGRRIVSGDPNNWHLSADGSPSGYVMEGAYWRLGTGRYQASVSLDTNGPIRITVRNDTNHKLLARKSYTATYGPDTLKVPFTLSRESPGNRHLGTGPFQYESEASSLKLNDNIEVRVWTPGHEKVSVYSVGITKTSGNRSTAVTHSNEPRVLRQRQ